MCVQPVFWSKFCITSFYIVASRCVEYLKTCVFSTCHSYTLHYEVQYMKNMQLFNQLIKGGEKNMIKDLIKLTA
jgi:hypothetical protein